MVVLHTVHELCKECLEVTNHALLQNYHICMLHRVRDPLTSTIKLATDSLLNHLRLHQLPSPQPQVYLSDGCFFSSSISGVSDSRWRRFWLVLFSWATAFLSANVLNEGSTRRNKTRTTHSLVLPNLCGTITHANCCSKASCETL